MTLGGDREESVVHDISARHEEDLSPAEKLVAAAKTPSHSRSREEVGINS